MALILKEKLFEKIRLYDGRPSVTSVLKVLKDDDAFERFKEQDYEWRERMLKAKGETGTKLHETIAKSYKDKKFYSCPTAHGPAWMKFYTKEWRKREPVAIEEFVCDDRIWWTLDCTMILDGEEYIVDRKTYWTKLYDALIFKYKMQLGKYAQLYNKAKWKSITKGKIVMFSSNKSNTRRILEIDNLDYRGNLFDQVQEQFFILYNQRHEIQGWTGWVQEVSVQG